MFRIFKSKITPGEKTPSNIPKSFLETMSQQLETINYIDSSLYKKYDVKRGLRNSNGTGVLVGLTNIGAVEGYKIDENKNKVPIKGKLYYRGYEIQDLVKSYIAEDRFGFEEVTYLLIFGELPTKSQLNSFKEYISKKRELPPDFARDMILTTPSRSIMNKLARSVLALYCYDENPDDTSITNVLRQSIDLIGYFPALLAYAYQAKSSYFDNKTILYLENFTDEKNLPVLCDRFGRPVNTIRCVRVRQNVTTRTIGTGDRRREVQNGANHVLAIYAKRDAGQEGSSARKFFQSSGAHGS